MPSSRWGVSKKPGPDSNYKLTLTTALNQIIKAAPSSFTAIRGAFDEVVEGIKTYHLTVGIEGLGPCTLWEENPARVSCTVRWENQ
jgi:hypothetical protein